MTEALTIPDGELPVNKRVRLRQMAKRAIPLTGEWESVVEALEGGDVKPLLALPVWERCFLEDEIPGVKEQRERLAPARHD